jgi:hypothetical protein
MITIYHYDIQNYFDGLTQEIPDGKYAYFIGPNWIIVDEKPPLPTPPEPPVTNEAPQVI